MKHRVLVVDDEQEVRSALKTFLDLQGYSVDSCGTPLNAFGRVLEESYDIVLLDINMPEMDGITLLKKIKARRPAIQVVMITAYSTLQKAIECWDAGAADYIIKPFTNMDEIMKIIRLASERIRRWELAEKRSASSSSFEGN